METPFSFEIFMEQDKLCVQLKDGEKIYISPADPFAPLKLRRIFLKRIAAKNIDKHENLDKALEIFSSILPSLRLSIHSKSMNKAINS